MKTPSLRRTLVLGLALLATPTTVLAQSVPPEVVVLGVLAGPPALVALICDVGSTAHLVADGTSPRALSITGLVFSGVDTGLSMLILSVLLSTKDRSIGLPLTEASVGLGGASLLLSLYATFHPPREPATPLVAIARSVRLAPWVARGSAGALTTGGALALRW